MTRLCYLDQEHLNQYPCDPLADQEVVDSIEGVYYNDDQFDTSDYELKVRENIPGEIRQDFLSKPVVGYIVISVG